MSAGPLEIPIDPLLGDLRTTLSPGRVLEVCREALERCDPAERRSWRAARVIEALYHPGRYVRIAYVLLSDPDTPDERLWPEGQICYVHLPVREPMSRRGVCVTIDGRRCELYSFPNDRRLRGLRKFAGKQDATRDWQRWLDARGDDFVLRPETLQRKFVRYVPEQKWIVRLRAEGRTRGGGDAGKKRIAVRSADGELCARLAERHRDLAAFARSTGLFVVPDVIGCEPEQGLLAIEWIRGSRLCDLLLEQGTDGLIERVAKILRAFHQAPGGELPAVDRDSIATRFADALRDLELACPKQAPRLCALHRAIQRLLDVLPCGEIVTLHHDFHWDQLRIKKDRYALLDLERMRRGDPLIDAANFVTQLRLLGVRDAHPVDPQTAARWAEAFLHAWRRAGGAKLDPLRFHTFCALSALELGRGMMRHLRPGWRQLFEHCLLEAETAVERAQQEAGVP